MRDWSEVGYIIDTSVWLTPKQAAELYQVATQTLYNKKSKGELNEEFLMTDGRSWYIHKDMPRPTGPIRRSKGKKDS